MRLLTGFPALVGWCHEFAGSRTSATTFRARIVAGVILLERLKWVYEPDEDAHFLPDGSFFGYDEQALRCALRMLPWTTASLWTGATAKRFVRGAVCGLLAALRGLRLDTEPETYRLYVLEDAQRVLLEHARKRLFRQPIQIIYRTNRVTADAVGAILQAAAAEGKEELVAGNLVAARLALQYPDSAASIGAERSHVGDATFYVSLRGRPLYYEYMKQDALVGLRPYLLVSSARLATAREAAEDVAAGRFHVNSVDRFVSSSMDKASVKSETSGGIELSALIETYNNRFARSGGDESLLLKVQGGLKQGIGW